MKKNYIAEGPLRHHAQKAFNVLFQPSPQGYVTITRIHPRTGAAIQIEVDYYVSKDEPDVQLGDASNKTTGSDIWLSVAEKREAIDLAWQDMKNHPKINESRMIRTTVGTLRSVIRQMMESTQNIPVNTKSVDASRSGDVEYDDGCEDCGVQTV